jgi:uncharacterized protein YPO0396
MHLLEADLFATPGFRLSRFEVFNWGTFDRDVWTIQPAGENALITGDIGSGKSTLVDALTTLLVPPQRIIYNKAAGAESRERNLLSYVRGYYKSEKDDARLSARSVGLRGPESYSVILAVFYNEHYNETVSLAHVLWSSDERSTPERFYVVATKPLSIATDFSNFGGAIPSLKKRLRQQSDLFLSDSFSQYGQEFRRRMGIASEQVLDLFYQTVSMKSVANITDFVREHMLEAPNISERIEDMCRNFTNLNAAHESVKKAKDQIERLTPLVVDCEQYSILQQNIELNQRLRAALSAWFGAQKAAFLEKDLMALAHELVQLNDAARKQNQEVDTLYDRQTGLKQAIADNGGRRIEEIMRSIIERQKERERCRKQYDDYYAPACMILNLPRAMSLDTFHANRRTASQRQIEQSTQIQQLKEQNDELTVSIKNLDTQCHTLADEIHSLKSRTSNIPSAMLSLRQTLCQALDLEESALPFIGELIQVRAEEQAWEGAIERVLRGFGLSLLVAEVHYAALADYVDRQHLGNRLVYFRVQTDEKSADFSGLKENSLPKKLEFKSDSPFRDWLRRELLRAYDYVCCESLDEFRHYPKALTRQGQLKMGGMRHEKDDRSRIGDRTRYVLGWCNEDKIRAFEIERSRLETEGMQLLQQRTDIRGQLDAAADQQKAMTEILRYNEYSEIDWPGAAQAIQALEQEKQVLEASSDMLRDLNAQLAALEAELNNAKQRRSKLDQEIGNRTQEQATKQRERDEAYARLALLPEEEHIYCFTRLLELASTLLERQPTTARQCDEVQPRVRDGIQAQIDSQKGKVERLVGDISRQMQAYRNAYSAECREVDAKPEAADEYRRMLEHLTREDLPRFEAKFKAMLNEQTINEVALLQNKLDQEAQHIRDKIDIINRSLCQIEYNPGTFIQLVPDQNPDIDIRQFQQDLRSCLADTLVGAEDDIYSEHKFLQVKAIIDRLQGREGFADLDRRWKQKVSDVRNWSLFSASERWKEDNTEREFYSDSAGKSGGQKEKLAYTILASALVYQYGIEQQARSTRSFRFVMIDEAFGRGSDESAHYGLKLFRQLGLQLLIVTPLQKIHVIEDYVNSVHLVHNRDGRESLIRSLTIEQYHEEKTRRENA